MDLTWDGKNVELYYRLYETEYNSVLLHVN